MPLFYPFFAQKGVFLGHFKGFFRGSAEFFGFDFSARGAGSNSFFKGLNFVGIPRDCICEGQPAEGVSHTVVCGFPNVASGALVATVATVGVHNAIDD